MNNVYAIAQTKDGYLWLGTSIGLLRFDGVDFTLIGAPPVSEIRNTRITCLSPARDGGLWFGLEKSSYGFHSARGGWFVGMNPRGDVDWDVPSLLETRDRTLWVGGDYCSRITSGTTNLQLLFAGQPNSPLVTVVFEDSKNRVWFGTADRGLYYWQDGTLNKFPDSTLEGRIIHALAEDPHGRLWVGANTGLSCYGNDFQRVAGRFPGVEISCLLVDRHGVLWIGTAGRGLYRHKDNDAFNWLQQTNGLANDSVLALAEDREGSIWVGTRDGMSQITDVKFPTFSSHEGIPAAGINSVSASPRGGLWVSSAEGATYFNNGHARTYSTDAGFTVPYVKRVLEARNGEVYVLSGQNEIQVLAGNRVVARHITTNMPVALVEDSKGVIVSISDGLYRVSRDSLVPYEFTNGRKPDLYWILNLAPGRDDSVWVACVNGVCRVKNGAFQQWTQKDGLADFNTRWVFEEPDGTVWAGMTTGIARLRDGQIHNLRRKDGLLDFNICAIVPDERDNLWVYTRRGLFLLKKQNVDNFFRGKIDHVECTAYEGPEGYGQEDSACRTLDGHIWFPGSKGVIVVDPANIPVNRVVPPVHVHRVRASGVELDTSTPLVLNPGKHDLEFSYTALSFNSPQKIRFRYKLEGLDQDWIDAKERRLAYYANLLPGRYTFRVVACNADGVWNGIGDAVQVALLPYFYQTLWFRFLCGVAAVGAAFGGYRWRLRHLTRKQQSLRKARDLLEKRVRERTAELATANLSLRDEIHQRSRVQSELESQKTELVAEIEERKRMEVEVERVHQQLLDASRQAGQAEVAAGVLHNVGNVLNSVNVSTSVVFDRLRKLQIASLAKAAQLMQEHAGDLVRFLTQDERGRKLPYYLERLAQHLKQEQNDLLAELSHLGGNVEHIKDIVAMQQTYARVSGVLEKVEVTELVENALKMQAASYHEHTVSLDREYETVPAITVDRHKALQILINVLQNAKQACDEGGQPLKKVIVRIRPRGRERVAIEIADNGAGIAAENLTRIFSHGFTTRKNGHGFGLHSAALAAGEMGGSLTVRSEGTGKGATFMLDLPLQPAGKQPLEHSDPSRGSSSDETTLP